MRLWRGNRLVAAFTDLRLAAKIVCLVGLLGVLAIAISLYSMASMRSIDQGYRSLIDNEASGALLISDTSLVLGEASRLVYAVLTEQEEQAMRAVQGVLQDLEKDFDTHLAQIRAVFPYKAHALDGIAAQARDVFLHAQNIVDSAARWRGDRALLIIHDQFEPALRALRNDMDQLRSASIQAFRSTAVQLNQATNQTMLTTALAVGGALALVLALSVYLTITQISRPIRALTHTMRRLTDRVYDDEIPVTGRRDEVGTMAQALQVFRDTMLQADKLSLQVEASDQARRVSEQIAREKAAFLAVMSHEIRTPLNAMLGMSQLMLKSELSAPQRERVHGLLRAGQHLRGIVDDILDMSKIDHGKLQIDSTDFSLQQVLGDILSMMRPRADAKNLALYVRVAPDVPDMLVGDPMRIRQVLLNYIGNAIKFTDTGQVEVMLTAMPADAPDMLHLHCQVRDSGIGMDAAQVGLLFQAFHQADASITRRFGGTGLGLAISRKLAQLMGGDAGARSTLGRGSTFWFTVLLRRSVLTHPPLVSLRSDPRMSDAPASSLLSAVLSEPPAFDTSALRGLRVLLVDDNPMNRVVATGLLESGGLLVDAAVNGQEALEILDAVPDGTYALVLMDMQMPVLDGLAATRQLRANTRFARLPVIAMTANATSLDRESTAEAGMDAHIAKPVDEIQMWKTLDRVMAVHGAWRKAGQGRTAPQDVSGVTPEAAMEPVLPDTVSPDGMLPASSAGAAATAETAPGLEAGFETGAEMSDAVAWSPAPLEDLRRRLAPARFQSLLDLFDQDCQSRVQRICMAAEREDVDALRREAHDLVSTAGNFGLLGLSAQGRALRAATQDNDDVRMRAIVARIQRESVQGLQWLRAHFSTTKSGLPAVRHDRQG